MRHCVKLFIMTLLLGAFFNFGNYSALAQQSLGGPTVIVKPNGQTSVNPTSGTNLDLSRLAIGQSTYVEMRDSKGVPYTFRLRKMADERFEVAANVEDLGQVQPNTTMSFIGKNGVVKTINLTSLQEQRCGVWCLILHVCCIHIHIGPPANTWEWSCTNCQPGQN